MKTWPLRFRAIDKSNFDALKSGAKSMETRAATPKYRQIQPGDILAISCAGDTMRKEVKSVQIFPSVEAMFREIPMESVMPEARTLEDALREYHSYPGYEEKLAEYGVIALELT